MPDEPVTDTYARGVYAIDTDYVRPRLDAAHLIVRGGHAAFVDCGTNHSVPNLLAALDTLEVPREAVDYLFLTHVHLDHAGGEIGRASCRKERRSRGMSRCRANNAACTDAA